MKTITSADVFSERETFAIIAIVNIIDDSESALKHVSDLVGVADNKQVFRLFDAHSLCVQIANLGESRQPLLKVVELLNKTKTTFEMMNCVLKNPKIVYQLKRLMRALLTNNSKTNGITSIGTKLKNMLTICKSGLRKQLSKRNGIW